MTATAPSTAPVLSTPDTHIFTDADPAPDVPAQHRLSDDQIYLRYEIERTVKEIRARRWTRVALQFPDDMLRDSARVVRLLQDGLGSKAGGRLRRKVEGGRVEVNEDHDAGGDDGVSGAEEGVSLLSLDDHDDGKKEQVKDVKLTILGDTSYGSCCVDEIAAEHVDAEVVVHYGRACLSPTARLPVVHVFTERELDYEAVVKEFERMFPSKDDKIIVTADTPFASHVKEVSGRLEQKGYENIYAASIVHNPSSSIPNRTLPLELEKDPSLLNEWHLFHISHPPTSLLLTLSSRMKSIQIFPTSADSSPHQSNTSMVLRRRYALITSLTTVSTWGVLINTLSVKNYLHMVTHVKKQIANADKKSYLFVVGKLNAAKVANFAEVGGWVVIGCWESSLIDSRDFYRPIITPFELEIVLQSDEQRIWTGEWRSDFQGVLDKPRDHEDVQPQSIGSRRMPGAFDDQSEDESVHDYDSEEESMPPEFDLRTGKYISSSRPMRSKTANQNLANEPANNHNSTTLSKRSNGDVLAVKGVASPAAQFLAEKRTWRGLGSDFEIRYDDEEEQGGLIEEGRTGVASGYTMGDSTKS